jgi:hypothetical protein
MDGQLDFNNNRLLKGLVIILVLLFAFILIKYSQVKTQNNNLEDAYEKKLQQEISKKEAIIATIKIEIEESKQAIILLEDKQDQYKHSLDSLFKVKQRFKTIYRDRIIELESFNSIEIENYWKTKFRIDE